MSAARDHIFDDGRRTDAAPAKHGESTYEFLNRVAGDYWEHPRALMQTWLNRISEDQDRKDLRQRFRSRDDDQFRSAFLEVYLHECLVSAGYAVTIHPVVPGSSHRPDFRAEGNGQVMFVEAIAPGTSAEAKAAAQRRAVLFDTVNQLRDPNFILWLEDLEEATSPPASARLRSYLRNWVADLDPDSIPDIANAPTRRWQHDGWSATFRAIPKRPEARGTRPNDRAIGVYGHGEASFIDDVPAIIKSLTAKHHAYGDLGAPFIIAVGTYIFDTDGWQTTNAMYGRVAVELSESPTGELLTREMRQPDGYFGVPPTWANDHVAGVLLVNQLMPYYVQRAEVTLWRHPLPLHPLPEDLGPPWRSVAVRNHNLTETLPAMKAHEFLGLPEPWPPGEPWTDE